MSTNRSDRVERESAVDGALPSRGSSLQPQREAHDDLKSARKKPPAGFGDLLTALRERTSPEDTVATAVQRALSFDSRFDGIEPAGSLSVAELALLEGAGDADVRLGEPPQDAVGEVCHLGVYDYGRPYIALAPPESEDVRLYAWAELGARQLNAVESHMEKLAEIRRAADDEMNAFLESLDQEALDVIVAEVTDMVDHTDPIIVYVEDSLFTAFDRFNNLIAKAGRPPADHQLLHHLTGVPISEWTTPVRQFMFCAHLLYHANLRMEEFNGRQFSPWSVREFFVRKRLQYQALTDEQPGSWPERMVEQASFLGARKQQLLGTHQVYRWVDSLSFFKQERWWEKPDHSGTAAELPESVRAHCLDRHAVSPDGFDHHDGYFMEVVRSIARLPDEADRSTAIGDLLEVILREVIEVIPSHVAMTRGMRDLRHFQDAIADGRYDEICEAHQTEGYCAVVSRNDSAEFCYPAPLAKVLTAISRRMQFNNWHYIPGHFDQADLTDPHHFYYPPGMPDISEWGEFQHGGHSLAQVRHAIRYPSPLVVEGRTFTGLFDIRLMRGFGHPYTELELHETGRYVEYVRSILQGVLSLRDEGLPAPVVNGWDREHYSRRHPEATELVTGAAAKQKASSPALGRMLREAVREHADRSAIAGGSDDRTFSYGEVGALAARLSELTGGRPGAKLGLLCGDRVQQAMLIAAGIASGHVVCPIDDQLPIQSIEVLLRHVEPDVIVTDASTHGVPSAEGRELVRAESLLDGLASSSASELPDSSDGGLLIYTSGTTGSPKGALLDEHELAANVAFAMEHFGYDRDWVSASLLPLFHTFTLVSDLFPVLCRGGKVVISDCFTAKDAGTVERAFERHEVQSYSAVPIIVDTLLALNVKLPGSLRFAITGAAPLSERTRNRYLEDAGHPLVPCYGLTESVCFAAASPVDAVKPGSAGRPAGIEIRVLGGDLQPLPAEDFGEIALRGPSVITGSYFHDGGERLEVFLEDGWFLTGDMGYLDRDGYLFITGRQKNMVIRAGEKLYLEDLDGCLQDHPGVADACCIQTPGTTGSERAVAFLVAHDAGSRPADDEIIAHAQASLGFLGRPDELIWVDRIPRSATGKPLRTSLRKSYQTTS